MSRDVIDYTWKSDWVPDPYAIRGGHHAVIGSAPQRQPCILRIGPDKMDKEMARAVAAHLNSDLTKGPR